MFVEHRCADFGMAADKNKVSVHNGAGLQVALTSCGPAGLLLDNEVLLELKIHWKISSIRFWNCRSASWEALLGPPGSPLTFVCNWRNVGALLMPCARWLAQLPGLWCGFPVLEGIEWPTWKVENVFWLGSVLPRYQGPLKAKKSPLWHTLSLCSGVSEVSVPYTYSFNWMFSKMHRVLWTHWVHFLKVCDQRFVTLAIN